jgi:hypothetical protein
MILKGWYRPLPSGVEDALLRGFVSIREEQGFEYLEGDLPRLGYWGRNHPQWVLGQRIGQRGWRPIPHWSHEW